MESSSSDTGKEEDDESSSSSSSGPQNLANPNSTELDKFREQWQEELKTTRNGGNNRLRNRPAGPSVDSPIWKLMTVDEQAWELFMQGSELERSGKVFDAMRLYRRATQLVPDIESKVYAGSIPSRIQAKQATAKPTKDDANEANANNIESLVESMAQANIDEEMEDLKDVDLVVRFQTLVARSCKLINRAGDRTMIATGGHFSDLPLELILYILRWVVSNDLDMKSLEQFASVSRGCYLLARDSEIWRHACLRIWGVHLGLLEDSYFGSWRDMFIKRTRLLFGGCYISRISYLRYGENSFQDQFYRPVQQAVYYRYLRFFADGSVLMLTTADEPQQCVSKLRHRSPMSREILRGQYRLLNETVIIAMYRSSPPTNAHRAGRKGRNNEPEAERQTTFYIEMHIAGTTKRPFSLLHWQEYTIKHTVNHQETTTEFTLNPVMYPPFFFSRVKSYHQKSEGPLN